MRDVNAALKLTLKQKKEKPDRRMCRVETKAMGSTRVRRKLEVAKHKLSLPRKLNRRRVKLANNNSPTGINLMAMTDNRS